MEKFGAYLKYLRETHSRISQTQLASMIGVSQRYISQIEISASQPPTIDLCQKICESLNLSKEESKKLMEYAATDRFSSNKSNKPFINFLPQFENQPLIANPNDSTPEETYYRNRFSIQWEKGDGQLFDSEMKEKIKTILLNEMNTKEYSILEIHFTDRALRLILSLHSPDISIRMIANKIKSQLGKVQWKKETSVSTLDPITVVTSSH